MFNVMQDRQVASLSPDHGQTVKLVVGPLGIENARSDYYNKPRTKFDTQCF
jgi:hypothetical protein